MGTDTSAAPARRAAERVPPLNPEWTPGQAQPSPYDQDKVVSLDPAQLPLTHVYPFVISAVVPRPIAFIVSQSKEGVNNASPYSYFNVMGHDPPVVAIGLSRSPVRPDHKKDSLTNIEALGEFVVCIISEWWINSAHHTCGDYDADADEIDIAKLTPIASAKVKPPRLKEAAVQLECKLRDIHRVYNQQGDLTCSVVLAEVVMMHVQEGVTGRSPTGKLVVDPIKLAAVGRYGGYTYSRTLELYDIRRPNKKGEYQSDEYADVPQGTQEAQQHALHQEGPENK